MAKKALGSPADGAGHRASGKKDQKASGAEGVIDDGRVIKLDANGELVNPEADGPLARARLEQELARIAAIPAKARGCACGMTHDHGVKT